MMEEKGGEASPFVDPAQGLVQGNLSFWRAKEMIRLNDQQTCC